MDQPRVTVICLSYNHQKFVGSTLQSVLDQDYKNVELIVADDASTDGSANEIEKWLHDRKMDVPFLRNSENLGNCKTFNKALKMATGDFVIDLAADDLLMPSRISKGVDQFLEKGDSFGVQFTDAVIVTEEGGLLGLHSELTRTVKQLESIPHGDVFPRVLEGYFICPPTLMFRKEVIDEMGGYNEDLSYEDFDFLVRASRNHKFCYLPEPLVERRITSQSHFSMAYKPGSDYLESTFLICENAMSLIGNTIEKESLNKRLAYEFRQVVRLGERDLASRYAQLMEKNGMSGLAIRLNRLVARIRPLRNG